MSPLASSSACSRNGTPRLAAVNRALATRNRPRLRPDEPKPRLPAAGLGCASRCGGRFRRLSQRACTIGAPRHHREFGEHSPCPPSRHFLCVFIVLEVDLVPNTSVCGTVICSIFFSFWNGHRRAVGSCPATSGTRPGRAAARRRQTRSRRRQAPAWPGTRRTETATASRGSRPRRPARRPIPSRSAARSRDGPAGRRCKLVTRDIGRRGRLLTRVRHCGISTPASSSA